jgi:hypothetical protein
MLTFGHAVQTRDYLLYDKFKGDLVEMKNVGELCKESPNGIARYFMWVPQATKLRNNINIPITAFHFSAYHLFRESGRNISMEELWEEIEGELDEDEPEEAVDKEELKDIIIFFDTLFGLMITPLVIPSLEDFL